jgi:hypothetical protein
MTPNALMGMQFTFSLILFSLVAVWYISPALRKLPLHAALAPLFLVHALRYLPTSAFAPGQIGSDVPRRAMAEIAYGDLASAVLALAAAVCLYYRVPGAIGLAWIVNTIMTADWLYAGYIAATNRLVSHPLGGNWYILNYYAPVIGVIHVMIFTRLLGERVRT